MRSTGIWIPPPGGRRRQRRALWPWLLIALAVLVWLPTRAKYPLVPATEPRREAAGAFHVHSTASDGRLSPTEIAAAAARAGLDFVVLTDHNVAQLGQPAYVQGVLLVPAEELSTPAGHLLALGTSRALTAEERAQDPIGHVNALGGFAVLAHPVQTKRPWTDWTSAPRARGLELYSGDTFLREALHSPLRLLTAALSWPLNPVHMVVQLATAPTEARDRLLGIAAKEPYVSLCAHDAHGLPWPAARAYESQFRALSLHLPTLPRPLPSDPVQASRAVLAAIGSGTAYCAFDALAPGDGFVVSGVTNGQAQIGDRLQVVFPRSSPKDVQLRVSGAGVPESDGRTVRLTGPGAVELELWVKGPGDLFGSTWRPWIIPSPVRVLPRDPVEAKAQGK